MRVRTFAGLVLALFAPPALAGDPAPRLPVPPHIASDEPRCAPPVAAGPECPGAACQSHTSALDRLRKLAAAHADAPGRASYAVKLRNVPAADVAHAMHKRFGDALVVAADPMRNVLVASGDPERVRRALDLASELDVAPPQVVVSGLVLEVKREFLSTAGLVRDTDAAPATAWTLSARETHMLMQLVRHEKANGDINVLSRPTVQVADNQTGFVQATQEQVLANYSEIKVTENKVIERPVSVSVGLSMKVTPRVLPCGEAVALRVETDFKKPAPGLGIQLADGKTVPGLACQQLQATATLKRGESCVLTGYTDKDTVTLVILTPAAPPKPAAGPGWFLR